MPDQAQVIPAASVRKPASDTYELKRRIGAMRRGSGWRGRA